MIWNIDLKAMPKDRPCLVAVDELHSNNERRRQYHVSRMLGSTRLIGGNFAFDLPDDRIVAWTEIDPYAAPLADG